MKSTPGIEEVRALAESMGMAFNEQELEVARKAVTALLPALDVHERYESELDRPPTFPGDRTHQWRPSLAEDPHRTFITRCEVPGAAGGPLAGLRLGVKDAIAVAGMPMTQGTRVLEECVPDFDATIVHRALEAGATLVGKLNMEPFSSGVGTAGSRDFGVVTNPWDPTRSPGGSSSGSGAAIAAGTADVAYGTDSGGSVRVPAAWCGAVGFKPSHGVLPMTGVTGFEPAHDHAGPLARDVATVARVMDCVAGRDGYDLVQVEPLATGFAERLDRGVEGLRIGILEEGMDVVVEPDVAEAVEAAVDTLAAAGAIVERVSLPLHADVMAIAIPLFYEALSFQETSAYAGRPIYGYVSPGLAGSMAKLQLSAGSNLPLFVKSLRVAGRYLHSHYYGAAGARSAAERRFVISQYDELLSRCDVLTMPTVPMKAPVFKPGATFLEAHLLAGSGGGDEFAVVAANTWPFNFTGHPAITIPCEISEGLPVALQLVGRRMEDATVLQVASAFQQLVDWDRLTVPTTGAAL